MGLFNVFGKKDAGVKPKQVILSGPISGSYKVQDCYKIMGVGIVAVGQVVSGSLVPGQKCEVNGKTVEIKSIEAHHERLSEAKQGENVGLNLDGNVSKADFPTGAVLNFYT